MNNDGRFPQEQSRNQTAEADVVLEKEIAPTKKTNQLREGRAPTDSIIQAADLVPRGLSNDVNVVAGSGKLFGENL